jgi:hypothetical protein
MTSKLPRGGQNGVMWLSKTSRSTSGAISGIGPDGHIEQVESSMESAVRLFAALASVQLASRLVPSNDSMAIR